MLARMVLSHESALYYYLFGGELLEVNPFARANKAPKQQPNKGEAEFLAKLMRSFVPAGLKTEKVDVLVSEKNKRYSSKNVRAHLWGRRLPNNSICAVKAGEFDLQVVSPELLFVQMAAKYSIFELAYLGALLTGKFFFDKKMSNTIVKREKALTTARKIKSFLKRLPSRTHGLAKALVAIMYVIEGGMSPMEIRLAQVSKLPNKLGGFNLGEVKLNDEICFARRGKQDEEKPYVDSLERRPDIHISNVDSHGKKRHVLLEYDSSSYHLSPGALTKDASRRNLMNAPEKYSCFSITAQHMKYPFKLYEEMDKVRMALGLRRIPYLDKRFAKGRSFGDLLVHCLKALQLPFLK